MAVVSLDRMDAVLRPVLSSLGLVGEPMPPPPPPPPPAPSFTGPDIDLKLVITLLVALSVLMPLVVMRLASTQGVECMYEAIAGKDPWELAAR